MTKDTLETANKLANDVDSLRQLIKQNDGSLTITYGGVTKTFSGNTKDDIIAYLCELRDIRKEMFERL